MQQSQPPAQRQLKLQKSHQAHKIRQTQDSQPAQETQQNQQNGSEQQQQKRQKNGSKRKQQNRPPKPCKPYSLRPDQHENVVRLLEDTNLRFKFHQIDDRKNSIKGHNTGIMGSFKCNNPDCTSAGWFSKSISTTIRLYSNSRYNARVYHQRCKECDQLSKPQITGDSYAERVVYRLKVWSDVDVAPPPKGRRTKQPHLSELCEGCKVGDCQHARTRCQR